MAVTFTSTMTGANADYMRYLWSETKVTKTDRYKDSALLDFALVPWDASFVKLRRGAYIKVDSTVYPNWFTGYVVNDPELSYLGVTTNKTPVWGYKYQATSDEYLLSLKPIGVIPPFMNMTMGAILKALAELLAPGVFDTSGIQDGPFVAQYAIDIDKKFLDVTQDACESASFRFYGNDKKLYYEPQENSAGSVTLDGNDKHFTPANLQIKPSTSPIINDVTVLGGLEPQTYVHEYFVGTGLDAAFPLVASVFGADTSVLIDESFQGDAVNSALWTVYDTVQDWLQVSNGYLNCVGGSGNQTYDVSIRSVSPLPMDGRIRFTHGEWDFGTTTELPGDGVIAGCWTVAPSSSYAGCLYGIQVDDRVLKPIVNGVVDSTQSVTVAAPGAAQRRYVIRTLVEFTKHNRTVQTYSYIKQDGTVGTFGGDSQADTATWSTLITEVNPADGTITNQWVFKNTSTLNGVNDTFATYTPIASDSLFATVTGITVSVPVSATLETATKVAFTNLSFDSWTDTETPVGWTNPTNVFQEQMYITTGCSLKLESTAASVEQAASSLIEAGTAYNLLIRLMKNPAMTTGTLKVHLTGTGIADAGFEKSAAELPTDWATFTGQLVGKLDTIPSDLTLKIEVVDSNGPMWVDSVVIFSAWEQQLIGPNEIDAMDGLAPLATIVSSNTGSDTKSTIFGTPQYNPGQSQLVFFKDSTTRTSDIPPENQIVRLSYRSVGAAIGRSCNASSVTAEGTKWGDGGNRSIVRSDLVPRPRTCEECEMAAAALVSENAYTHYEGTYNQYSDYFSSEPRSGGIFKFVNLSNMADVQAEEINQVVTTLESQSPIDRFIHTITFGKPDRIRRLLAKFDSVKGSFQKAASEASPVAVDTTTIGTTFAPDVTKPVLEGWDDKYLYIDAGQDLAVGGLYFEVRYTDVGWGADDGKNLITRAATRKFAVPRSRRGRVFFIKQAMTGKVSRYAACIHVGFPPVEVAAEGVNPPALPTSVVIAEKTNSRRLRQSDQTGWFTLQITVTLPSTPVAKEWVSFWPSRDNKTTWDGGALEFPITLQTQTFEAEYSIPEENQTWWGKATTSSPSGINSPADAVETEEGVVIQGLANPSSNDVANASLTDLRFGVDGNGNGLWGCTLNATLSASDPYFWFAYWTRSWVDAEGNLDPNRPEQHGNEFNLPGQVIADVGNVDQGVPKAPYNYVRTRWFVMSRAGVSVLQVNAFGAGVDYLDTLIEPGAPPADQLTNVSVGPVRKDTNANGQDLWGADITATAPSDATFVRWWWTISWVDVNGVPDPSYPETSGNSFWTPGATVTDVSDVNWGVPPASYRYRIARYRFYIERIGSSKILQTSVNDGLGYFDLEPVASGITVGSARFIVETPKGEINGVESVGNTHFTLSFAPSPLKWLDLILANCPQHVDVDFSISGNEIDYFYPPQVGERHIAKYVVGSGEKHAEGNARYFDGASMVNFGYDDAFILTGDVSAGAWVEASGTGIILQHGLYGTTQVTNHLYALILMAAGVVRYFHEYGVNNQEYHDFATALPDAWRYVGFSRDAIAKTVSLYVGDGSDISLIETWTYTNDPDGGTDPACVFSIGNQPGGAGAIGNGPLTGGVGEVQLWNRTLTLAEFTAAMQGNPSRAGLVLACSIGSNPEQDWVGGRSGTVTGTTLVEGHV